ncbi:hypothetical protein ABW19_dt0202009 [Dactylella cylindrospora]|nr:hypothetical protein ABW19_dt0202009 [Dactylella cylindrospora]
MPTNVTTELAVRAWPRENFGNVNEVPCPLPSYDNESEDSDEEDLDDASNPSKLPFALRPKLQTIFEGVELIVCRENEDSTSSSDIQELEIQIMEYRSGDDRWSEWSDEEECENEAEMNEEECLQEMDFEIKQQHTMTTICTRELTPRTSTNINPQVGLMKEINLAGPQTMAKETEDRYQEKMSI